MSHKPYIPSARPKAMRHECRSKPKPGSKTHADKRKSENVIPRPPAQPPYTPLPRSEDYDVMIAWGWILGEGVE